MSGIVGLFNLDGRPVEPSELKRLAAASRHRAVDGEDFWIGSSMGIGHQHARITPESLTERQPFVSPSGLVVAFDGRLDNRQDILDLSSPGVRLDARSPDPALVAAAYERVGEEFCSHLCGDFSLALFDTRASRLFLARDRMGARTLYYCPQPRLLLFASEIKSLLAHPTVTLRADEDALADLALDGYSDGHHTCFANIYSVPPGHVVVATTEGSVVRRHWDFETAREIRYSSLDEYAEEFKSLFSQAVRRRLRSAHPVAVTVSGGLDSSSIFCQAVSLAKADSAAAPIRALSLTFPDDATAHEAKYLDSLEARSGVSIARRPVSAIRLLTDAETVTGHMEMPGLMWDVHARLFACARQAGCAVLLDGYFGDQLLSDPAYLVDLVRRGQWSRVGRDLRTRDAWMTDDEPGANWRSFRGTLTRALPPRWLFQFVKKRGARRRYSKGRPRWYSSRFLARAIERSLSRPSVDRGFRSRHAEQCYQHVTSGFYRVQVQRLAGAMQMQGLEVAYPFRDRDLVSFLMATPGEVVNAGGVPKGLLRRAMDGILPEDVRQRRWKADFTGLVNRGIVAEYPAIRGLLTRDCRAVQAGFVDADRLPAELSVFDRRMAHADNAVPGWQISDLVGLELWLRRFWGAAAS